MDIVTGYRGEPHITSTQDRSGNQGAYGEGSYILDVGNKMECTAYSATELHIADGVLSHQGCVALIPTGTYDTLEISAGTAGYNRIDLVVARYSKDAGTSVEDMELVVIEGTPTSSTPSAPSYNAGDIQAGASPVDMPLYQIRLSGITVSSITRVATLIDSLGTLKEKLTSKTTTYTPTFTVSSGTNPTVANISCRYYTVGNLMIITGRFQMTALGSVNTSALRISLPTGFTYGSFSVGAAGMIISASTPTAPIGIRFDSSMLQVLSASGGVPTLPTGYYSFFALAYFNE